MRSGRRSLGKVFAAGAGQFPAVVPTGPRCVGMTFLLRQVFPDAELLAYIRTRVDRHPRKTGQWLPMGSHEAPLMPGVTESLAGRAATQFRDLSTYRRFLALVASRHGQVLNKTDFAVPLSVSIPTIGEWLRILEVTGQILLVPPYFENFGCRIRTAFA